MSSRIINLWLMIPLPFMATFQPVLQGDRSRGRREGVLFFAVVGGAHNALLFAFYPGHSSCYLMSACYGMLRLF